MTPAWDIHIGGFLLPGLFWPAALLPGIVAGFLFMWPWLDGLAMRDDDLHNVLETPRDRPGRTAIGAGLLTFFAMLLLAGGDDVFAATFRWSLPTLLAVMQGLTIGLPFVVGLLVYAVFRRRHLVVADEVSP
jgi:ubiquinol-cytochrome c reductase cytochrome b subunit